MANHLVTRAYNRFEIKDNLSIVKRSETDRLFDETNVYRNLPEEFTLYFPRLIGSGTCNDEHFLELEYYAYPNAYWVMRNVAWNLKPVQDAEAYLVGRLRGFLMDAKIYLHGDRLGDLSEEMYNDKTLHYLDDLRNNFPSLRELTTAPELVINNVRCKTDDAIFEAIKHVVRHRSDARLTFMHGDLCLSNVLFGLDEPHGMSAIKLIDPRGRFGSMQGVFGDHYYDLAKLRHSSHGGYENIINDNFFVKHGGNEFWELRIPQNVRLQRVFEEQLFEEHDEDIIKMIEGLIFIGMCSRHYDSEERQKAMYLNGIKILNEVLDND